MPATDGETIWTGEGEPAEMGGPGARKYRAMFERERVEVSRVVTHGAQKEAAAYAGEKLSLGW